jgi:hypothetical protein
MRETRTSGSTRGEGRHRFLSYSTAQSVVTSEIASLGRLMHRPKPKSANRTKGISLLEMMLVVGS